MKSSALLFIVIAGGCSGSSIPLLGARVDDSVVMTMGLALDFDKLAAALRAGSTKDSSALLADACVPNASIHAEYIDGSTSPTVVADENCVFSVPMKVASSFRWVESTAEEAVPTYSARLNSVGTSAVFDSIAQVSCINRTSSLSGLAAARAVSEEALVTGGLCIVVTAKYFAPPSVSLLASTLQVEGAATSVGIYAMVARATSPPTFAASASSAEGEYGVFVPGLTTATTLTIDASDGTNAGLTYPTVTCHLEPGFVTFVEIDAANIPIQ